MTTSDKITQVSPMDLNLEHFIDDPLAGHFAPLSQLVTEVRYSESGRDIRAFSVYFAKGKLTAVRLRYGQCPLDTALADCMKLYGKVGVVGLFTQKEKWIDGATVEEAITSLKTWRAQAKRSKLLDTFTFYTSGGKEQT